MFVPVSSGFPFVFVVSFVVFVPSGCFGLNYNSFGYLVPLPVWDSTRLIQSSMITGGSGTMFSIKVIAVVSWISRATVVGLSASANSASLPSLTAAMVFPPTWMDRGWRSTPPFRVHGQALSPTFGSLPSVIMESMLNLPFVGVFSWCASLASVTGVLFRSFMDLILGYPTFVTSPWL